MKFKRFNIACAIILINVVLTLGNSYAKPPSVGGDFTLLSHHGEEFSLSDVAGKVAILFFGFTHCPDVCPNTLLEIQRLMVGLGEDAEDVSILFVSVDPQRDSVEKLASYVEYFNKNIIGLTGSEDQIEKVLKQYKGSAKIDGDGEHYNVEHTANLYLINRTGELSSIILPRTPYAVLEQQVRKLID